MIWKRGMKLLLLSVLLLCFGYCTYASLGMIFCPNGDADILSCLDYFMDGNHDGALTEAEIDTGLALVTNHTEVTAGMTGALWLEHCDFNMDGVLDAVDLGNMTGRMGSPCLPSDAWSGMFCWMCQEHGWTPAA